jgi:hypothetical protein
MKLLQDIDRLDADGNFERNQLETVLSGQRRPGAAIVE